MPGRMLDGFASGMGASFRRTPPEIQEVGQANLGGCLKVAGAVRSPHLEAGVGAQSRLADRTARDRFLTLKEQATWLRTTPPLPSHATGLRPAKKKLYGKH